MQTIKKVILVVICLVVLLTSFVAPAGAVNAANIFDDEFIEAMTDSGYTFHPEGQSFSIPKDDLPSFYQDEYTFKDEPYWPDFDIESIPWDTFPTNIQDIIYTSPDSFDFTSYDKMKVPFVLVRVNASQILIIVGYNLGLFYRYNDFSIKLGTCEAFQNSCMYQCIINRSDFSYSQEWNARTYSYNPYFKQYASLFTINSNFDVYLAGYPAFCIPKIIGDNGEEVTDLRSQYYIYPYNSDSSDIIAGYCNLGVGYLSGDFLFHSPHDQAYRMYWESFTIPSRAEVEAQTSKGILNTLKSVWESIKSLPSQIAESIKGFFTSLGDRISGFFDNLINYLLYFQPTKPEHVNPFADILTDVKSFFDEQMSDVGDFKNSLTSTLNNVVTYIETGSGVVNTFLTAVPVLSAFITFFVVFFIVRKVIGR